MKLRFQFSMLLSGLFILFFVNACDTVSNTKDEPARGGLISSQQIISLNAAWLTANVPAGDLPDFASPEYGVTAMRLSYYTEGRDGELIQASGALFIPVDDATYSIPAASFPLLSIQHGTQTDRDSVASVFITNSPEGFLGVLSAMGGYLTCIPDYIGMGQSSAMHPYIIADYTADAVVDFMRAAREYCDERKVKLSGDVYLAGYSEGGYATLATQKAIETLYSDEFDLKYSVPMAGPFDLSTTVDTILSRSDYSSSVIMGFLLTSYDYYYKWNRLSSFFASDLAPQMPALFNGDHGSSYIGSQLPADMTDLLKPDFVTSYLSGNETDVETTVAENSLLGWTPKTPMLLIHGTADETVPYLNSENAYNDFKARGCDVTFVPVDGGTHLSTATAAVDIAFAKFMEFLGK